MQSMYVSALLLLIIGWLTACGAQPRPCWSHHRLGRL